MQPPVPAATRAAHGSCCRADLHASITLLLTEGGLFALNKVTVKEQEERISNGEDPKIRPVNVGSALLKWGFQLPLQSPQAQEAMDKLSPIQMGLGAIHGTEVVGHLFRSLYEQQYAICTLTSPMDSMRSGGRPCWMQWTSAVRL